MPLPAELVELLVCPASKAPLLYVPGDEAQECLVCPTSRLRYRIEDGVPVLLIEEAERLDEEAAAALVAQAAR